MHVLRSRFWLAVYGLAVAAFAAQPARASPPEPTRAAPIVPAIYVGSEKISTPAFVEQRQLFVPVRGVFEAIDASVEFAPPRFVVVRRDGAVIAAFMLDRKHAIVGHRAVDIDAAPTRRDGRVYVPLRVVAQAVGATVAYTNAPPAVHIRPRDLAKSDTATGDPGPEPPSAARWHMGVVVFTAVCCLGCLVLTARRFAPTLFRTGRSSAGASAPRGPTSTATARAPEPLPAPPPPQPAGPLPLPAPERVAVTGVDISGEARLRKEIVKETRTIEVSVTREELVIEYAGEGGAVLIHGRELASGETVRIPLWEERVQVDVTKHPLVEHDIVVAKRRFPRWAPQNDGSADFGVAEGSPS